jgi:sugar phosphate isomerase/epimerase
MGSNQSGDDCMKLCVTAYCVEKKLTAKQTNLKEFIDFLSENDVKYVELLDFFWDQESPEEIKAHMEEKGVECACYSVSNNFLRHGSTIESEIARVKAGVDLAIMLGARNVRVFSSRPNENYSFGETMKVIINSLGECAKYAEERGMTLVLENHGAFAASSKQVLNILENVNSHALRINADTGNFLVGLEDPLEGVKNVYDKLEHLHIKDVVYADQGEPTMDGKFLKGVVIGDGICRIEEIVEFLKKAGYKGFLSLEYEGAEIDCYQGTLMSLNTLKSFMGV